MKHLIPSFLLLVAGAACAADVAIPANRRLTPEQRRVRNAQMMMKRFGGELRKANTAHGKVLFANGQKKVGRAALERALNVVEDRVHPIWEYRDLPLDTGADYSKILKDNKAELGVFIVEKKGQPMMLAAPECGWAVVNVAALDDGCEADVLAKRVRIEVLRAFAFAGGGGMMARDPIVMRPDVIVPKDLDLISEENYGSDVPFVLQKTLPLRGVTPWQVTTYKNACKEGWAPAPTNKLQQAIWDKVHAVPKNPMKIEFDPKKGR